MWFTEARENWRGFKRGKERTEGGLKEGWVLKELHSAVGRLKKSKEGYKESRRMERAEKGCGGPKERYGAGKGRPMSKSNRCPPSRWLGWSGEGRGCRGR